MKKLVIVLAVIAMAFGMSSCSKKGGAATPTEATKAYYELLKKGDFKGAVQSTYDYNKEMSKEEKESVDAMLDMTASKIQEAMNEKGGMKEFALGAESIEGEDATVEVTITYGNGENEEKTESLKKVGDAWFVK